jgi:hypothetical protein
MTAKKRVTKAVQHPMRQGTLTYHKSLSAMTPKEGLIYLQGLRARLVAKQQRERAYLSRRAARGTYAPTDEAYEADQVLESELLDLLDEALNELAPLAEEER